MGALTRALVLFSQAKLWKKLVRNCMLADFSWKKAAKRYEEMYFRAIDFRSKQLKKNPGEAYQVEY